MPGASGDSGEDDESDADNDAVADDGCDDAAGDGKWIRLFFLVFWWCLAIIFIIKS